MQIKLAIYDSPTRIHVYVPNELTSRIGRLDLVSVRNDEQSAEVKLRRKVNGHKPSVCPSGRQWKQYIFGGRVLRDAVTGHHFGKTLASVSANGDEVTLHVKKQSYLEPLEDVLA